MGLILKFLLLIFLPSLVFAGSVDTKISIYNANIVQPIGPYHYRNIIGGAFISEVRNINIKENQPTRIEDLTYGADPSSLMLTPKNVNFNVLESNYIFDTLNRTKLLEKNLGKNIAVETVKSNNTVSSVSGTLVGFEGNNLTIQDANKNVISVANAGNITFTDFKEDFSIKPAINVVIKADQYGDIPMQLNYLSSGFSFDVSYKAILEEKGDGGVLTLISNANLKNYSGKSFSNATITLIAGDVNKVVNAQPVMLAMAEDAGGASAKAGYATVFNESVLGNLYKLELSNKINLPNNSSKQVQLFEPFKNAKFTRIYEYIPTQNANVLSYLTMENTKENGLGTILPAGTIKFYSTNNFVGEDNLSNTPIGEKIRLNLGQSFDVVGERKLLNTIENQDKKMVVDKVEIVIRNNSKEDHIVYVKELVNRSNNWQISDNNLNYVKENAGTVMFKMNTKAGSEAKLIYTVTYKW